MKRRNLFLFLLLVAALLLLSGCGVPNEGTTDVLQDLPDGWWQTLVVWPLAKLLITLNNGLAKLSIPYTWGFAIILFTVAIKLVTYPLTITQIRGMQAQRELQPKIKELQKKYGKDRERLSQEQMKLYQEAGVNPLGGCLPLVVQMPVLFGLYSALVVLGSYLNNAHFFWIPDLGFPHYTGGMSWLKDDFQAGDYGHLAAYLVLPIILIASQFLMSKMTTPPSTGDDDSTQAAMMKQMTTIMPLMFGFFTLQVPAGLSLYWVTSNLLQMGQQWLITRNISASGGVLAGAGASGGLITVATADDDSEMADEGGASNGKPKNRSERRKKGRR